MTVASAPGKIVLAGEYAVLWGAPAVCMAVDRRALARVEPSDDGECHLLTPGFSGNERFALLDAVSVGRRPARRIELDTRAFREQGRKTGIGSSAALTVALTAALADSIDVFEASLQAHGRLQGEAGSGIDIAAAVHGGLIVYERPTRKVTPLPWPAGLHFRIIWTGIAASTQAQIGKLAAQATQASRDSLLSVAPRVSAAWESGDADGILAEFIDYVAVLRQFSVDHNLGIFDAGHDELMNAAMADGLLYKPAGAGGGDIGVLFGRRDAELDAFLERHAHLVHAVLDCGLDPEGVRLEAS